MFCLKTNLGSGAAGLSEAMLTRQKKRIPLKSSRHRRNHQISLFFFFFFLLLFVLLFLSTMESTELVTASSGLKAGRTRQAVKSEERGV